MFFDTPAFGFFLVLVVFLYWRLDRKGQNVLLLVASYIFYGWWDIRFLGLIFASTVVDFFCARFVGRSADPKKRRLFLAISVCVNLGFLGYFKYFNFFVDSFAALAHTLGLPEPAIALLQVALPPGISFYTFQELAYIVDVYRNSPVFVGLRDPKHFEGKCGRCDFRALCGGSRARAYAATGSPFGSDPLCAYEPA